MNYLSLKSGTDIRGDAIETPAGPVQLTDQVVERIAAGCWPGLPALWPQDCRRP